ncbi:MAG: TIR domain-containing protein [Crocosphaera sp.]
MQKTFDAFISYGRADSKAFATKLYQQLTAQGFKVWFDQNDIPLAVDFQEQINDGIEKANNFLFIIAPHSVNSEYCLKEINLAVEYNKRIIPLLHVEEITQEIYQKRNPNKTEKDWQEYQDKGLHLTYDNPNMHEIICKINSLYFGENEDNFYSALNSLVETFHKHQDYVEQHTYYLMQGLEWIRNQQQTKYLLVGKERKQATDWLLKKFEELPPCTPSDIHSEFISESIKNANNLMTDVFLAYADKDEKFKEKIRKSLMRESLTIWTNTTDIKTGITFQEAINQGVEEADNFVYLISPDSLESAYCQQELAHAFANNKRIIPLLIQEIELDSIPSQVRELQFIDFTAYQQEEKYQESITQLLKELKQDYHYYEKHKTLLVKALKWQKQNKNPSLLLRGYNLQHFEVWLKTAQIRNEHPSIPLQEKFINASLKQPEEASLEVFISYSRTDSDLARKLNDRLQELGKTTWFDQESIATGTEFQQEIYRGIESSDNFLFIISPKSINSPYCADEVEYAQKLGKRFVTILHRPLFPKDKQNLHPTLASIQWLNFNQHGGEFAANFNELVRTLDTDRDHVRSHTEWSQQALKWQKMEQDEAILLRGSELNIAENWLSEAQKNNKQPPATELQKQFIRASTELRYRLEQKKIAQEKEKEDRRKRDFIVAWGVAVVLLIALTVSSGLGVIAWNKTKEAQRNLADSLARYALSLFTEGKELEGTIEAIKAGKRIKQQNVIAPEVTKALQVSLNQVSESNRLQGHNQRVMSMAISPNGETLVSGSYDNTIKIWNRSTGELIRTLFGHDSMVLSVAISPDGNTVVSGSVDKTIKIWYLETGELLRTLDGHDSMVLSVAISPDGNTVVSGSVDKTIKIWDLETGELLRTLDGHNSTVKSVAISPDGKTIVSGSVDKTIKIWDLETGELLRTLDGHDSSVFSVAISPDGKTVVSGSLDSTIKIWNLETKEEPRTLSGHDWSVESVAISPDGNTVVSGSEDKTIKIWNLETGKLLRTLSGHDSWVSSVAISPDGNTFVSGSVDKTIKIWNLETLATGELPRTLSGHNWSVISVAISPDGDTVVSGSADKTIKIWNLATGELPRTLSGHDEWVISVAISPDGNTVVSGSSDKTIKIWNLATGELLRTLDGHDKRVDSVAISPDGKTVVSGSDDSTIKIWDRSTGELLRTLDGHDQPVNSVAISPDGKTVVSGSVDSTIKIWDRSTGKLLRTLDGHDRPVYSVAISPDGKTVVSGSVDKTIKIWNLETGELLRILSGHDSSVFSVAISPDGKTVVSGSLDNTIKIWKMDFDWLMARDWLLARNCDHIRGYLANPNANLSDEERKLCDGIGEE